MLKRIGIIGEGKMGTNLFYYLLDKPFSVTWICSSDADIEKTGKTFLKKANRSFESGLLNEEMHRQKIEETWISNDPALLYDADLVIEAIPEDLDIKKELFLILDRVTKENCILVSNSSSILPSLLAPSPRRVPVTAGLHFFYPIALKNIVELIKGNQTSPETVETLTGFLQGIGKNYLIQDESSAFLLNRLFLAMQNEAFQIVMEKKAGYAGIDRLVKNHLLPSGVFDFFDSVGLDVMLASIKNYSEAFKDSTDYSPLLQFLSSRIAKGHLGMKSGSGFYNYSGEGSSVPSDDTTGSEEASEEQILERLSNAFLSSAGHFIDICEIKPEILKNALNEYFGDESPLVSRIF